MARPLDEKTLALIMTIVSLLGGTTNPAQARQAYSRVLDQIEEFRKYPDDSEHDEPRSRR
jgi:hypothetical protein